jgi:hypothetical protein
MLGGEPEYVREPRLFMPPHQLGFFDKPTAWYVTAGVETLALRVPRGIV